jgi:xanthosine utilization system XapX-like protein
MLYTLTALLGRLGILIILGLIRAAYTLLGNSTLRVLAFRYLSVEAVIAKGAFGV